MADKERQQAADSQIVRESLLNRPSAGDLPQRCGDLRDSIRQAVALFPTPFSAGPDPNLMQQATHTVREVAQAAGAVAELGLDTLNTEAGRTLIRELTVGTVRETIGLGAAVLDKDGAEAARHAIGAGGRFAADVTICNLVRRPRMTTQLLSLLFKGPPGQPPERG